MSPDTAVSATARRFWRRNLVVLWLAQFGVTAGLTIVVPLLPFYLAELGCTDPDANRTWTGWALAAPAIPLALMAPVWGRLGDRVGRKPMVVRAVAGIALAVVAMGLAASPLAFFLCRLAQGVLGGVDDAAAAFTSTAAPAEERGRAIGALQTATAAGALLGPLAGGFLAAHVGFAPIILTAGVVNAFCAVLAAWLLREERAFASSDRAPSATRPAHVVARDLFADRSARAFVLAGFMVQVGSYALVGLFATHMRAVVGSDAGASRWVGALSALTWAVTLVGAAYWGRRNDRAPITANFALAAGGCAVSVAAQALPTSAPWFIPLRAAQGFCVSALGQSVFLQVGRHAAPDERGLRIGLANSLLTLGQVMGALAGAVLGAWLSAPATFVCLGAVFALAAITVLRGTSAHLRSLSHERRFAS